MFWTRLLSGIVLLVIAVLSFLAGAPVLPLVLLLVSAVGYRELTKALGVAADTESIEAGQSSGTPAGKYKFTALEIVGYAGIVVYYLLSLLMDMNYLEDSSFWFLACIVAVFLAELFVYVITFPKYRAEAICASAFSFIYVPVMIAFIDFIRRQENGIYLVWLVLICSWGCDTFAYCVGMLIGKKKIFPVLSPKKSLEGCIGGVAGAALLGALFGGLVMGHGAESVGMIALICALGAVVSMAGDLAASAIKRNRGIKDYGNLIPGHGGIMDRFDSVIVTAPLIYFLSVVLL